MRKQNKIENQFSSPQIRHVPSGKSVLIPKSPASSPAPRACPLDRPSPAAGSSSRLIDRGPAEGALRQRLRRPGEGGAKNPRNPGAQRVFSFPRPPPILPAQAGGASGELFLRGEGSEAWLGHSAPVALRRPFNALSFVARSIVQRLC